MDLEFDNSYSRLPERFYEHCDPIPVAPQRRSGSTRRSPITWVSTSSGCAPPTEPRLRQGISSSTAPSRSRWRTRATNSALRPTARRWACATAGRVGRRRRPAIRRPAQRIGAHPLLSTWGDGRAPLGPVLREYVVSEAMHALGIPSTRSLVAAATRGKSAPADHATGWRSGSRRAPSRPRRHVRVLRRTRRPRRHLDPDVVRRTTPLPRPRRHTVCATRRRCPTAGRAHRPVAMRRVHPRRHEHRQYAHLRRDDRLRAMRIHERVRSGHRL